MNDYNPDDYRPHGACLEFRAWQMMLQRCHNPTCKRYRLYGARGIHVCERWRSSFDDFMRDMGPRPYRHSIDRIDNDGPYSPENCRWATQKEQVRNSRRSVKATYGGLTLACADWDEIVGRRIGTTGNRIKCGWPDDFAVLVPPPMKPMVRIAKGHTRESILAHPAVLAVAELVKRHLEQ